LTEKHLNLWN